MNFNLVAVNLTEGMLIEGPKVYYALTNEQELKGKRSESSTFAISQYKETFTLLTMIPNTERIKPVTIPTSHTLIHNRLIHTLRQYQCVISCSIHSAI